MRSIDRMKMNMRLIFYIIFLFGIVGVATWSLIRGAINLYFYIFFAAGALFFIVWNFWTRMKIIKTDIGSLIREADKASEEGQWQRAISYYDELLLAKPGFEKALVSKAYCLKQMTGFRDAIPQLKKTLEIKPNSSRAHFLLGVCYFEGRYTDEAIEHLNKAITLEPDFPDSYIFLGDIYKFKKENGEAIEFYNKFIELSEDQDKIRMIKEKRDQISG
ncbi:MAG: tetratricopeptide repeat protein [Candidatus Eremiobacteraeota bacterium]|nr:tetratricopeptide repeat protein [Candidatus Eremiobacteraeota bacterium]